jgi:hypothetical protein
MSVLEQHKKLCCFDLPNYEVFADTAQLFDNPSDWGNTEVKV